MGGSGFKPLAFVSFAKKREREREREERERERGGREGGRGGGKAELAGVNLMQYG